MLYFQKQNLSVQEKNTKDKDILKLLSVSELNPSSRKNSLSNNVANTCQNFYTHSVKNLQSVFLLSAGLSPWNHWRQWIAHPRRPRGSQSGREKRRDKSFQAQAEKPLGTDSHRTISKRSSECWLLIGHKKCFVLLCPIGEQHLLSSFREFVHDCYWLDHGLSGSCTKEMHVMQARLCEAFFYLKNLKFTCLEIFLS